MAEIAQNKKLSGFAAFRKKANSYMLGLTGKRFSPMSELEHKGRKSGRVYRTPVMASKTRDGFVIPLAYGEGVDWKQNIMAADSVVVRNNGRTYTLGDPQVIDRKEAMALMFPVKRLLTRLVPTPKFLRVRRVAKSA